MALKDYFRFKTFGASGKYIATLGELKEYLGGGGSGGGDDEDPYYRKRFMITSTFAYSLDNFNIPARSSVTQTFQAYNANTMTSGEGNMVVHSLPADFPDNLCVKFIAGEGNVRMVITNPTDSAIAYSESGSVQGSTFIMNYYE